MSNGDSWLLFVVYGSPNYQLRKLLWRDLNQRNLSISKPWMIVRDFNLVVPALEVNSQGSFFNSQKL